MAKRRERNPYPAPKAEPRSRRSAAPARAPRTPRSGRRGLLGTLVLWAFIIGVILPVGAVVLYRFVPPPVTFLMLKRRVADGEGLDYRWRSLDRISPALVQAVVASEDAKFCSHSGFDVDAIEQALENNEEGGRIRGGSTVSQQTAKNVFLWPDRSWVRKGLEAYFTALIEIGWPKQRIMEAYLNVAEWGPGVYGAEAASRHWFGKSAENLTRAEAARLAAILPSPRRYRAANPGPYVRRRSAAIVRRAGIVRRDGLAACVF